MLLNAFVAPNICNEVHIGLRAPPLWITKPYYTTQPNLT